MSFLEAADADDPEVAAMYARDLESAGYIANYTRAFSHRPAVYAGWRARRRRQRRHARPPVRGGQRGRRRRLLDVITAAAARCFFATVLDATGALPDAALADQDPALRDALAVGRPIG